MNMRERMVEDVRLHDGNRVGIDADHPCVFHATYRLKLSCSHKIFLTLE